MHTFYTITPAQIQKLRGCCYKTARKELQQVRDALSLAGNQPLMLRHVAHYWNVPIMDLSEALYSNKKKQAA